METLNFLAAPIVMCFILAGMHCYLGLHVLARGVVFVDLSLAQVAALGASMGALLGMEHHEPATYFVALAATFLAAALFALARKHEKSFSQEAIIGIVFAFSSAAVVLIVDRLAHGAEHIKEVMVGQILWVTWTDVAVTAVIYSGVAVLHWAFRRQFLAASLSPDAKPGMWDFWFYALFGVVITSSVHHAGVLQVFSYLIVPAMIGSLVCKTIKGRLFFGWGLGMVVSLMGLFLSHRLDMPAGAMIVVCFGALPIVLLLVAPLLRGLRQDPRHRG